MVQKSYKEQMYHSIEADGHCTIYSILLICPYVAEQMIEMNKIIMNTKYLPAHPTFSVDDIEKVFYYLILHDFLGLLIFSLCSELFKLYLISFVKITDFISNI